MQSARKQAGLNVDDRIRLAVSSENVEIMKAVNEHEEVIMAETLTAETVEHDLAYSQRVTLEGHEVIVSLEKV